MNDADRAALQAWRDLRAAQEMHVEAASVPGRTAFDTTDRIARLAYEAWLVALGKARVTLDVATLKGGR